MSPCVHYIFSYLQDNQDSSIVDRNTFCFQMFNVFKLLRIIALTFFKRENKIWDHLKMQYITINLSFLKKKKIAEKYIA